MSKYIAIPLVCILVSCGIDKAAQANKDSIAVLKGIGLKQEECPSFEEMGFNDGDPRPLSMICSRFEYGPDALMNRLNSLSEDVFYQTTDFEEQNYPVATGVYAMSWRARQGDGERMQLIYVPQTHLLGLQTAEVR